MFHRKSNVKGVQRFMITEEFSVETKDSKKDLYGFKYNRNTEKQAHISLHGTKIKQNVGRHL